MADQSGSEDQCYDHSARRVGIELTAHHTRDLWNQVEWNDNSAVVPRPTSSDYESGGSSAQQQQQQQQPDDEDADADGIDTPISESEAVSQLQLSPSAMSEGIDSGRIRDSLELDMYKNPPSPPHLCRTLSQEMELERFQPQWDPRLNTWVNIWDCLPPPTESVPVLYTSPFQLPAQYRGYGYDPNNLRSLRRGYDSRDRPSHALSTMPLADQAANWWRRPVDAAPFPTAGPLPDLPDLWQEVNDRRRRRHVAFADRQQRWGGVPMRRTRTGEVKVPGVNATGAEGAAEAEAEFGPKSSWHPVSALIDRFAREHRINKAKNAPADFSGGVVQQNAMAENGANDIAWENGPPVGGEASEFERV
ncbi:hypothetical protein Daus18300_012197 [Diaporthe australafricana]|uniref:Uncharacterized protein n=1 Tax=Diaporthe australafricana TaxID=127596 RepID=A0ABR3W3M2_9PEZI